MCHSLLSSTYWLIIMPMNGAVTKMSYLNGSSISLVTLEIWRSM
jgi:hypothetical protein